MARAGRLPHSGGTVTAEVLAMAKRFQVVDESSKDEPRFGIEDTQTGERLPDEFELKEEAEEACEWHNVKHGD